MPSPALSSQLSEAENQPDLQVLILAAPGERRQRCWHRLPAVPAGTRQEGQAGEQGSARTALMKYGLVPPKSHFLGAPVAFPG